MTNSDNEYYDEAKRIYDSLKNKDSLSSWQMFLSGYVCGMVTSLNDDEDEEVTDKRVPVYNADGSLKNSLLKVAGKSFWCDCGCNVFHQPDDKNLNKYQCNSCKTEFSTE